MTACTPRYESFEGSLDLQWDTLDWKWFEPRSRDNEDKWNELRQKIREEIQKNPEAPLLLLGDSITQGWRRHRDLIDGCLGRSFEEDRPYVINGGIWSDGLQHIRWRLQSGDLKGLHPRLIVFLAGTNNGGQTPWQIARGIQNLVEELAQEYSDAHILLLGIFPMDQHESARRLKRKEVNQLLAQVIWNNKRVTYRDLSAVFLGGTSELSKDLFPDFLHLSRLGYGVWASSICPLLKTYL
jgi:lysophospholipase L1-like esterase